MYNSKFGWGLKAKFVIETFIQLWVSVWFLSFLLIPDNFFRCLLLFHDWCNMFKIHLLKKLPELKKIFSSQRLRVLWYYVFCTGKFLINVRFNGTGYQMPEVKLDLNFVSNRCFFLLALVDKYCTCTVSIYLKFSMTRYQMFDVKLK